MRLIRIVSALVLLMSGPLAAQQRHTGLTAGLAVSTQYPDRFQDGCGNPAAAVGSIRAHHQFARFLTAELGLSGLLQLPPGATSSCGDALPLQNGDVVRAFATSPGSTTLSTETRVVLTPMPSGARAFRLIGGGAWFPAHDSPAWFLGVGYRPPTPRGAFLFDIEHWRVGVAYDLERFRTGLPREHLGNGREWQGFWVARFGVLVWSR